jgi:uncharacterized protein (TIGR02145 family)
MKQLFTFLCCVVATGIFAQTPQSIPYQAVVRNTDGSVMAEAAMTITFKIYDNSATGTEVYEETHTTTTNAQGLVSLNVGEGTVVTGTFVGIQWGSGSKFLHVLMNAGNGVVDLGTQQMMSVPYALYAEEVNVRVSVTGDTLFIGNNYSIVPGVSAANPVSISNYGSVLLPGNTTCQNELISVTGCGGQDSLLYYDRYYSLVEIGGQCWFAENLATDKYSNGDLLGQDMPLSGQNNSAWFNATSGMYSIANESLSNDVIYGKLYNWYAAVDGRGVCPIGWHTPSDCEWMFLEKSVGVALSELEFTGNRGGSAGNALKSTNGWSSPNTLANNLSGFSALPGGIRGEMAIPITLGYSGYWWAESKNESNITNLHARKLQSSSTSIYRYQNMYTFSGLSIRCIKD